jgi:hypothetical protein
MSRVASGITGIFTGLLTPDYLDNPLRDMTSLQSLENANLVHAHPIASFCPYLLSGPLQWPEAIYHEW